jgi:hypothetical protein
MAAYPQRHEAVEPFFRALPFIGKKGAVLILNQAVGDKLFIGRIMFSLSAEDKPGSAGGEEFYHLRFVISIRIVL